MKLFFKTAFLFCFVAVPFVYNSCGSKHESSFNSVTNSSVGDNCIPLLATGVKPVYDYLQPRCTSCHFLGSSSAPQGYYFADSNISNAYVGFANIIKSDAQKIYDKVYDPAHFGGSGPSNMTAMEPLRTAYMTAAQDYRTCLAEQANNPGPGGPAPNPGLDPTVQTIEKTIPANQTAALNVNWNLTNELLGGRSLDGAQFQITVQVVNPGRYNISLPSARGTTASALSIRNLRVYLNGSLISVSNGGGTWTSLNALASRVRLHPLSQGTGIMILTADTTRSNTIGIGFGAIEPSALYPDFNPTTFTRLTSTNTAIPAAERVFRTKCMSCHTGAGGAGGVGLDPASLGLLKLNGDVISYLPSSSSVYSLMSLPNGTPGIMPPGGRATDEEIRWVRDWILDGAPP